jgi:NADH-quinone oxidoreductase subunit C
MTPKLQRLHDSAKNALGPRIVSLDERLGELTLVVKASDYLEAARTLRDHPDLRFEQLVDLCGVDYSTYGDRPAAGPSFAAVLHLLSFTHNWRLRLRCFCPEDAFPVLPSMVDIWRILTDYGFIGHPFRKDFPVSGHVEMRYDPEQKRVVYQPVTIEPREVTPRVVREAHYAEEK